MAAPDSALWTTDATGDGATGGYTQAEWVEIIRYVFGALQSATNGVLDLSSGTDLAVTGTASPVSVAAGAAVVYGFIFWDASATSQAISTPVVGTKGFRINLRASWAAQTVRVNLVESADGVAAIPALVQTPGTTYDLPLATGTITTGGVIALTDARGFVHFPTRLDVTKVDGMTATRIPFGDASGLGTTSADLAFDDSTDTQTIGGQLALINTSATQSQIRHTSASGAATLNLDAMVTDGSSAADISIGRNTNSSGTVAIRLYKGDGTSTQTLTLNLTTGVISFLAPTVTQAFVLGVNAQGLRIAGLVAEPVGTLGLKRQGGSATDWSIQGSTNRTIGITNGMRDECGVIQVTITASSLGQVIVTFPTAFSNKPIVIVSQQDPFGIQPLWLNVDVITTTTFRITAQYSVVVGGSITVDVAWLARGPE